jgi:hypothetical protein
MKLVMGPIGQAQQHNEKKLESFSVSKYSFRYPRSKQLALFTRASLRSAAIVFKDRNTKCKHRSNKLEITNTAINPG